MPRFVDYPEYDKKMYADHTQWCEKNGKDSAWDLDGRYKHFWYPHTRQADIFAILLEKADREEEVWQKLKKHMEIKREQDRNERNTQHNSPWKNQYEAEDRRVAEKKKQEIAAAIAFLHRNGIKTVPR